MISEEDMENVIEPEVLPANQLQVIVKEAGLAPTDAQFLLGNFEEDFKNVAIWAKKASKIIVTDESQKVIMEEARTGRLFLAKIRIEVEKNRKTLKEDSLRRGKAIDTVANFIKDLIIPTEQHLIRQEKFIELKKEAEDKAILEREHARIEAERLAQEKKDAEEKERLRIENAKLIKEREEGERLVKEKLKKIQEENEKILRIERDKNEIMERELLNKKQAELKAEADKIRAEEALLKADDADLIIILKNYLEKCPFPEVRSHDNKRMIEDAKSYVYLAIRSLKITEEEV